MNDADDGHTGNRSFPGAVSGSPRMCGLHLPETPIVSTLPHSSHSDGVGSNGSAVAIATSRDGFGNCLPIVGVHDHVGPGTARRLFERFGITVSSLIKSSHEYRLDCVMFDAVSEVMNSIFEMLVPSGDPDILRNLNGGLIIDCDNDGTCDGKTKIGDYVSNKMQLLAYGRGGGIFSFCG